MHRSHSRKPAQSATQPLAGLNHTVLAGSDGAFEPDAGSGDVSNRLLVLEVLSGGRRGLIKRCNKDKFRLGRRSHNDLSFDGKEDRAVSGNHLLLERRPDAWWAQDLKSTNGTLLNGKPLTSPTALQSNDILELGRRPEMGTGGTVKLHLRFEAADGTSSEETQDEATKLRVDDLAPGQKATAQPTLQPESPQPESPQAQEPPVRAPAASAQPETAPTQELVTQLQDKTLELGRVSYRLEDLLAGLCRAALEDDAIEVASLPGGEELLAGIESRAQVLAGSAQTATELAGHARRAEALLAPLQEAERAASQELADARKAAAQAQQHAGSSAQACAELNAQARATLASRLGDLATELQPADATPAERAEEPLPAEAWIQALDLSSADLRERKPALEAAAHGAANAAQALQQADASVLTLSLAHAKAADQHERQAAAMAARRVELEDELARLQAATEPAEDQERAALASFAEVQLAAGNSPLAALPGHAKAAALATQRSALEAEVAALRQRLGG